MVDKELDIEWPLDENVKLRVTRLSGDIYDLEDFNKPDRKREVIIGSTELAMR